MCAGFARQIRVGTLGSWLSPPNVQPTVSIPCRRQVAAWVRRRKFDLTVPKPAGRGSDQDDSDFSDFGDFSATATLTNREERRLECHALEAAYGKHYADKDVKFYLLSRERNAKGPRRKGNFPEDDAVGVEPRTFAKLAAHFQRQVVLERGEALASKTPLTVDEASALYTGAPALLVMITAEVKRHLLALMSLARADMQTVAHMVKDRPVLATRDAAATLEARCAQLARFLRLPYDQVLTLALRQPDVMLAHDAPDLMQRCSEIANVLDTSAFRTLQILLSHPGLSSRSYDTLAAQAAAITAALAATASTTSSSSSSTGGLTEDMVTPLGPWRNKEPDWAPVQLIEDPGRRLKSVRAKGGTHAQVKASPALADGSASKTTSGAISKTAGGTSTQEADRLAASSAHPLPPLPLSSSPPPAHRPLAAAAHTSPPQARQQLLDALDLLELLRKQPALLLVDPQRVESTVRMLVKRLRLQPWEAVDLLVANPAVATLGRTRLQLTLSALKDLFGSGASASGAPMGTVLDDASLAVAAGQTWPRRRATAVAGVRAPHSAAVRAVRAAPQLLNESAAALGQRLDALAAVMMHRKAQTAPAGAAAAAAAAARAAAVSLADMEPRLLLQDAIVTSERAVRLPAMLGVPPGARVRSAVQRCPWLLLVDDPVGAAAAVAEALQVPAEEATASSLAMGPHPRLLSLTSADLRTATSEVRSVLPGLLSHQLASVVRRRPDLLYDHPARNAAGRVVRRLAAVLREAKRAEGVSPLPAVLPAQKSAPQRHAGGSASLDGEAQTASQRASGSRARSSVGGGVGVASANAAGGGMPLLPSPSVAARQAVAQVVASRTSLLSHPLLVEDDKLMNETALTGTGQRSFSEARGADAWGAASGTDLAAAGLATAAADFSAAVLTECCAWLSALLHVKPLSSFDLILQLHAGSGHPSVARSPAPSLLTPAGQDSTSAVSNGAHSVAGGFAAHSDAAHPLTSTSPFPSSSSSRSPSSRSPSSVSPSSHSFNAAVSGQDAPTPSLSAVGTAHVSRTWGRAAAQLLDPSVRRALEALVGWLRGGSLWALELQRYRGTSQGGGEPFNQEAMLMLLTQWRRGVRVQYLVQAGLVNRMSWRMVLDMPLQAFCEAAPGYAAWTAQRRNRATAADRSTSDQKSTAAQAASTTGRVSKDGQPAAVASNAHGLSQTSAAAGSAEVLGSLTTSLPGPNELWDVWLEDTAAIGTAARGPAAAAGAAAPAAGDGDFAAVDADAAAAAAAALAPAAVPPMGGRQRGFISGLPRPTPQGPPSSTAPSPVPLSSMASVVSPSPKSSPHLPSRDALPAPPTLVNASLVSVPPLAAQRTANPAQRTAASPARPSAVSPAQGTAVQPAQRTADPPAVTSAGAPNGTEGALSHTPAQPLVPPTSVQMPSGEPSAAQVQGSGSASSTGVVLSQEQGGVDASAAGRASGAEVLQQNRDVEASAAGGASGTVTGSAPARRRGYIRR